MVKCILEDFKYEKKEGEIKSYTLLVLNEDGKHRSGIELTLLSKEEQDEVVKIQQEYEKKIEPFVKKAYRSFTLDKIITEANSVK